jgi:hypothetical protein
MRGEAAGYSYRPQFVVAPAVLSWSHERNLSGDFEPERLGLTARTPDL